MKKATVELLTQKQRGFAQDLAKGLSLADAYRKNYDCENMKDSTVYGDASTLLRHPKVAAYYEGLLKEQDRAMLKDGVAIRRHVIGRLLEESNDYDKGNAGSRLKALELLGKLDIVGMFRDRGEMVVTADKKPDDIEAELRARLGRLLTGAVEERNDEPVEDRGGMSTEIDDTVK